MFLSLLPEGQQEQQCVCIVLDWEKQIKPNLRGQYVQCWHLNHMTLNLTLAGPYFQITKSDKNLAFEHDLRKTVYMFDLRLQVLSKEVFKTSHKNTSRAWECRTCGGPYRLALDDRLKDSQERCVYSNSCSINSKVLSNNYYFILRKNVVNTKLKWIEMTTLYQFKSVTFSPCEQFSVLRSQRKVPENFVIYSL